LIPAFSDIVFKCQCISLVCTAAEHGMFYHMALQHFFWAVVWFIALDTPCLLVQFAKWSKWKLAMFICTYLAAPCCLNLQNHFLFVTLKIYFISFILIGNIIRCRYTEAEICVVFFYTSYMFSVFRGNFCYIHVPILVILNLFFYTRQESQSDFK
jgi:hypothetical protein